MIKTFTFAILHFAVAFSVAYLLTGSIAISSTVALVEPIVNTVAFFFHEKAWQRFEAKRQVKPAAHVVQWRHVPASCCAHHRLFVAAHDLQKAAVQNNASSTLHTSGVIQ